ncbi:hypothetical protein LLEC1_04465 [Akanthomyces lecanii]|uniref:Pirin N-terminal domain-containing protein n=1 Tax=Cordyceps confragosa TaxID=2714763 RepID=A0A179IDJ9_CORDF|nr:hypothetical protein LLEC1_04465 [Akanthomyces lecanii]
MPRFVPVTAILISFLSTLIIILHPTASTYFRPLISSLFSPTPTNSPKITTTQPANSETPMIKAGSNMSKSVLRQAKITPHRSGARGHSDHGWLNTYHSFSFADWYDPKFVNFGALRVLNEDREADAEPAVAGSIPIHADFAMGAGIVEPERTFEWVVGARSTDANKRKVYVHVPMTQGGKAKIRIDGREDAELAEGDGAFVEGVYAGDKLAIESIGSAAAEVIVLDTA